jgi:hypothetical protein
MHRKKCVNSAKAFGEWGRQRGHAELGLPFFAKKFFTYFIGQSAINFQATFFKNEPVIYSTTKNAVIRLYPLFQLPSSLPSSFIFLSFAFFSGANPPLGKSGALCRHLLGLLFLEG